MYMVTDHFKSTRVAYGSDYPDGIPTPDRQVNHTNLSVGPSLSHVMRLNERFSFYYGFKLLYYDVFPFPTDFGVSYYHPQNSRHVMSGMEPTIHAGIRYQLSK